MSYNSLYKLYVMNDISTFNDIYIKKFNSSATIKFDLLIKENQSFFTHDSEIMSIASKINSLNYRLNEIFESLPVIAKDQYMRKSLIDEIHYTNQIEGVISTRKDINDLITEIEKKTTIRNRLEGIVNKYLMLTNEKINFLDSKDIRKLYDEMLYNEIKSEDEKNLPDGEIFRKDLVHVYKSGEKIVHNGLMPESKIIDYMNKALNILNSDSIDVLIRISIFHYFLGYIHPFYDGNGRINRFISSYILSKYFNKVVGFRLSMTIKENLSQYLDAFDHTNDVRNKGDVSTFVYEFLDIIYKSFQKTELYTLEKMQQFNKYMKKIDNVSKLYESNKNKKDITNLLFILIQCSIFGDFGLNKTKLIKILEKGSTKISEYLAVLKQLNLCLDIQSGKNHYFKCNLEELDLYE